jgi:membrane protease YdiL (CAAX protease family)
MSSIILVLVLFFTLFFILKLNDDNPHKKTINFVQNLNLILYGFIILLIYLSSLELALLSSVYFNGTVQFVFLLTLVLINEKNIKKYFKPALKPSNLIVAICFTLLFTALQVFLSLKVFNNEFNGLIYENWIVILMFYSLLPAVGEELFFRGLLYDKLIQIYSARKTILITSLLFYFSHLFDKSFWVIISVFPFGLLLGYLRFKHNNLIYLIVCHIIYNFIIINYT